MDTLDIADTMDLRRNKWRAAVDDALICHGLDCTTKDSDPVECVSRLIRVAVDMALDPAISERAAALAAQASQQPAVKGADRG